MTTDIRINYQKISDQIILCKIECDSLEAEFSEDEAKFHLRELKKLLNGKLSYLIVDAREVFAGFKLEALRMLSSDDEINQKIGARAFVTDLLSTHLIFSFYKRTFLKEKKSQIFQNIETAIEYCESHLKPKA